MTDPICVFGLMSGSSMDGLDMAICRFEQKEGLLNWSLSDFQTVGYPVVLYRSLSGASTLSGLDLNRLDAELSRFAARMILQLIRDSNAKPDYISSHGHTIYHEPGNGMTLQIIHGGILASITGISTISDFRTQDVALGGQGAPIVPIAERDLWPGYDYYLNLGGICNVTYLSGGEIRALDVCPCNQVFNELAGQEGMEFDDRGKMASEGNIDERLLNTLNAIDYYKVKAPKSLDNNWIREYFINLLGKASTSVRDKLRTMAEHLALQLKSVVTSDPGYSENKDRKLKMFVTGGGTFNTFLLQTLEHHLSPLNLQLHIPSDEIIQAKEAILMAYMGYLRILGKENILHSVTGAKHNSCAGAIYLAKS